MVPLEGTRRGCRWMKVTEREGKRDLQETVAGVDQEGNNEVGERVGLRHGERSCERRLLRALRAGQPTAGTSSFHRCKKISKKDN